MATTDTTKHARVYRALEGEILSGQWRAGDRLPSEAELVERFGVSRITVGRAVRDLQRAGLVERRAGSGTYVRRADAEVAGGLSFGLLIPDLGETEIFEPICQGMMASPRAHEHALLWGSPTGAGETKAERAWHLCRQYVERRVSGVFFAPLERSPERDEVNLRIERALEDAGIPVVLLDRPVRPYPERGPSDLVGIDNARAGYIVTDHLVRAGSRRPAFVAIPDSAATVDVRESGYREALHRHDLADSIDRTRRLDPDDADAVSALLAQGTDGIVCANDWTAARLMRTLLDLGWRVPEDVRLVGIDDVEYAKLLPVPLTTFRQPTREIGAAAIAAMLERVAHPEMPTRDILLHGELVVRRSCGA